jgi:UDP-glucose 4-epimerase
VLDDLSTGRRENVDPRSELVVGDVADAATVRGALDGMDGCFHLAAIASVARGNEDWLGTHRINQTGTIAILDAARRPARPVPVVYASSAAIYGDIGGHVAAESLLPAPLSAYGADKLGSELHASVAWRAHRLPALGLRFFNVYGPRQDPASPYSGVVSIFAARLAAGEALTINGDGSQSRDFVFVADVVGHLVAGLAYVASQGGGHVFNVCTGKGTSVLDLAHLLARLLGVTPQLQHGSPRVGDIARSIGDPTRATAALGVRAETTLADGLRATLVAL